MAAAAIPCWLMHSSIAHIQQPVRQAATEPRSKKRAPTPPSRQKPRFLPVAQRNAQPNCAASAAGDFQPIKLEHEIHSRAEQVHVERATEDLLVEMLKTDVVEPDGAVAGQGQ
jgi:hypothetical protein